MVTADTIMKAAHGLLIACSRRRIGTVGMAGRQRAGLDDERLWFALAEGTRQTDQPLTAAEIAEAVSDGRSIHRRRRKPVGKVVVDADVTRNVGADVVQQFRVG